MYKNYFIPIPTGDILQSGVSAVDTDELQGIPSFSWDNNDQFSSTSSTGEQQHYKSHSPKTELKPVEHPQFEWQNVCPPLFDINNGFVNVQTYQNGTTTAEYRCNNNTFLPIGKYIRHCNTITQYKWTGSEPTCVRC